MKRALLGNRHYGPYRCDCCGARITKTAWARHQVRRQEAWIREHGTTVAGYVARYGSVQDADYYGAGGEVIFEADSTVLRELRAQLAELER